MIGYLNSKKGTAAEPNIDPSRIDCLMTQEGYQNYLKNKPTWRTSDANKIFKKDKPKQSITPAEQKVLKYIM